MIPPVQSPSTTPQIVPDASVLHQRDLPVVCRQHVRVVDQTAKVGTSSLPNYQSEALPSTTILSPPSDSDFTPPLSADRKRKRVTFAAEEDIGCDAVVSSFRHGCSSNVAAMKNRTSYSSSEKRLCCDNDGVMNETTFDDCMRGEHVERAINRSTSYLAAMPLQSVNCNILDDTCHSSDESMTSIENASQQMALAKSLPADPRSWTRTDVHNWLLLHQMRTSSTVNSSSQPLVVDVNRFRMNGKALCLMTSEMFAYRVPHGGGGQRLYKDFQMRLCRAVALSLHRTCTAPVVDAPTLPLLSVTSTRQLQQQLL